ncbi:hypothetical protein BGX30_000891 [Mortierella sp. GBA39]|nr:hypothetical protein BGX30_000891 [Mortierella sp. GBA39]
MSLQFSDTSPLPLQLQIESQVRGTQKLAYLPTATTTAGGNGQSPSLDFYYLNYRPTYLAGSPEAGKIDFWMLTPEGSQAPATGSLELFDEFGKIRLATLVEEGTAIPRAVANQNKPFLWKTWKIPQTLQADFDFSEKFRIVLKTSDHIAAAKKAANANHNNGKRQFGDDAGLIDFLLVKNKNKHVNSVDNASTLKSVGAGNMVVQDRQFRIKSLTATPGGKPNPAKLAVNSIIASPKSNTSPKATPDEKSTGSTNNINAKANESDNAVAVDKSSNENDGNVQATETRSAASSPTAHLQQFTAFMAVVLAATMGASFF